MIMKFITIFGICVTKRVSPFNFTFNIHSSMGRPYYQMSQVYLGQSLEIYSLMSH